MSELRSEFNGFFLKLDKRTIHISRYHMLLGPQALLGPSWGPLGNSLMIRDLGSGIRVLFLLFFFIKMKKIICYA